MRRSVFPATEIRSSDEGMEGEEILTLVSHFGIRERVEIE